MKTNSHILLCLVLLACAMTLSSCQRNAARKELAKAAESFNKELPYGMSDDLIQMTSCTYQDGVITFKCSVDDDLINISKLKAKREEWEENVKMEFSTLMNDQETATVIDLAIDAEAIFKCIYVGKQTGETIDIELTKSDLQEIKRKKDNVTDEDRLAAEISTTNLMTPMQVDEETVLTSVKMEGAEVIYNYILEENGYTVDQMKNSPEIMSAMKEEMLKNVNSDEDNRQQASFYAKCEKYLVYRCTGSKTSQSFEIKISPREILDATSLGQSDLE